VISSSHKPLPDNTQHSQQTDIHAPGGIRTHNLNRRAAADLRLRPRGHWDRLFFYNANPKFPPLQWSAAFFAKSLQLPTLHCRRKHNCASSRCVVWDSTLSMRLKKLFRLISDTASFGNDFFLDVFDHCNHTHSFLYRSTILHLLFICVFIFGLVKRYVGSLWHTAPNSKWWVYNILDIF